MFEPAPDQGPREQLVLESRVSYVGKASVLVYHPPFSSALDIPHDFMIMLSITHPWRKPIHLNLLGLPPYQQMYLSVADFCR